MARRSSGSRPMGTSTRSAFSRPAPATPMPTRSTPVASRPAATPSQKPASAQTHQAQAATPATSSAPGFLGTMAASAAGSVAGHWLSNKLFSGDSATPALSQQAEQAIDSDFGTCAQPFKSFLSCVEANSNDIASCQWVYSQFANCRQAAEVEQ